jgi:hypothetical protein
MRVRIAICAACALLTGALASSSAMAVEAGPGWEVTFQAIPTHFAANPPLGFPDGYTVDVTNSGSRTTNGSPITIADTLPAGLIATEVKGIDLGRPKYGFEDEYPEELALSCTLGNPTVSCVDEHPVRPGDILELSVVVNVSPTLAEGTDVENSATVFGGGGASVNANQATEISSAPAPFGFENFRAVSTDAAGQVDTQAGDHPYENTVTYDLNVNPRQSEEGAVAQDVKDFVVDLPPGFVGNPQVVQKCPQDTLSRNHRCPASDQIGVARLTLFNNNHELTHRLEIEPIYNMVPDPGYPAEFAFRVASTLTYLLVNVNQETNYGVRVLVRGIPRVGGLSAVSTTFFGTPLTDPNIYNESVGGSESSFLQDPVDCSQGALQATTNADAWESPGLFLANGSPDLEEPNWKTLPTAMFPSMTGCNMLSFAPVVTVTPSTTQADEPTGLDVDVRVPQARDLTPALATPELKDATVTLPAGVSLSPSAADGLQGCSDAQVGLESIEPAHCPEASVLGTAKLATPLLSEPLEGHVYLGSPGCDPCTAADAADGKMLRIFLVLEGSGVRVKKQGTIYANPSTGQITTTFTDNPELPFENLELNFKSGLRAGLATPQACGVATTTSDFTPWSSPVTPDANPTSSFRVDWDGSGSACPAIAPLSPSFSAGTSNPNAGQFSPLTLTFAREDREQDLAGIQVRTPPGLLGILTGVPLCAEPQATLGTCGEGSRIGSMTVAAGPGSHPFYEKGALYLTGPYKGAPFGLSIVVPTVAGPFNLGNVVVRAKINVNPKTAALSVTSDPLPQIIDGIPLRLRSVNVTVDRPNFIFNPTDCSQLHIEATITGAQGAVANLSAPFAVSGCAGLPFGPKFSAYTAGHTSRANGASLYVRLQYPHGAQSNISHVKVELPKQLPSRLTTLQKACPDQVFEANPSACPAASVVGIASATTPVLPVPLVGPAYFVSHGNLEFPNLIVVLQGYGVSVQLVGNTFISKRGITSSTFTNVPDVQVSSFSLYLPEGPYSALAANGNLCKLKTLAMPSSFIAQDGAQLKQKTKIQVTGCRAAKRKATAAASRDATDARSRKRTAGRIDSNRRVR